MAYTKNTWASGDVVTSAKLNNIENGIANSVLLVSITWDNDTEKYNLDKSYNEIKAVFDAGGYVFGLEIDGTSYYQYPVEYLSYDESDLRPYMVGFNENVYDAADANTPMTQGTPR